MMKIVVSVGRKRCELMRLESWIEARGCGLSSGIWMVFYMLTIALWTKFFP